MPADACSLRHRQALTSINAEVDCICCSCRMVENDASENEAKRKLLADVCKRRGGGVEMRETHMSWIFLGHDRVYKLKKPVIYPFLDFSTPQKRYFFCMEELRLNRRLAAATYLDVIPLCRKEGMLIFGGAGEAVDWVVEMVRLPQDQMLDDRLARDLVQPEDMLALGDLLTSFYMNLPPQHIRGDDYLQQLSGEQAINRAVLCRPEFQLENHVLPLLARLEFRMKAMEAESLDRIAKGVFREGHGDLRPEHICMRQPFQIIDCIEFNRPMRIIDPYDEIAYLGLECDVLGYNWIGPLLLRTLANGFGFAPTQELLGIYSAAKALLRARLCMVHLLETPVRQPHKWRPLAMRYIAAAERKLANLPAPSSR